MRETSRVVADLAELDRFGRGSDGGFTRTAWSQPLRAVLEWAADLMADAGLEPEIDAAGNLIGRWQVGEGKAIVLGSHLDTVTSGGRFDGALGVLSAIEAVRRLRDEGFRPSRPVWVVAFMDEEGERFNSVMLGSRAFVGAEIPEEEAHRQDAEGITMGEAMAAWGTDLAGARTMRHIDYVAGYVELHCELGPVLEQEGIDIGVVTDIVGLVGLSVTLEGRANHAGTTPMPGRHDALVAAAKAIVRLRDDALAGAHMATVGSIATTPGGANAIPGTCTFSIDLRAANPHDLAEGERQMSAVLEDVCAEEGVTCITRETYRLEPVPMAGEIVEMIEQAAEAAGLSHRRMPSGAGHDAMLLAPFVPCGMLFVPSVRGVGHSPAEHTDDHDVENGTAALTETLRRLVG